MSGIFQSLIDNLIENVPPEKVRAKLAFSPKAPPKRGSTSVKKLQEARENRYGGVMRGRGKMSIKEIAGELGLGPRAARCSVKLLVRDGVVEVFPQPRNEQYLWKDRK